MSPSLNRQSSHCGLHLGVAEHDPKQFVVFESSLASPCRTMTSRPPLRTARVRQKRANAAETPRVTKHAVNYVAVLLVATAMGFVNPLL
jgi:hypothetical protein